VYELTCRLRQHDGKLVSGLKPPTSVTFRITETEECKQNRFAKLLGSANAEIDKSQFNSTTDVFN
jgi:hypothetical protein